MAAQCIGHFFSANNSELIVLSVPATWMDWTPWSSCSSSCGFWSSCSTSCGPGATRQKSRNFMPGRHGANHEPDEGNSEETQVCSTQTIPDWPTCPIPARIGSWESWSPCTQTCYNEGSRSPFMTRRRKCIEATLSTNNTFNTNIATCNDFELSETMPCGTPLCPGEDTS